MQTDHADEGAPKRSVTVQIAGEQHTLRSEADPDYTRACARFLDEAIAEVREAAGGMERHRAVILAALSITDRLFRAREDAEALREEVGERMEGLTSRIRERLEDSG